MKAIAKSALETSRLILTPTKQSDALDTYEILKDPALYEWIPSDPPSSIEELAKRYAVVERGFSRDGSEQWLNWIARCRSTEQAIGQFEATIIEGKTAKIAYTVGRLHWKQGYAFEAVTEILRLLKSDGVRTAIAELDSRNKASRSLASKLGMFHETTIVGADFFKGASSDEEVWKLNFI